MQAWLVEGPALHNEQKHELDQNPQHLEEQKKQKDQKVILVTQANTVIHPGTVVVEAVDALVADVAVATALCLDSQTVRTEFDEDTGWVTRLLQLVGYLLLELLRT